jgi:imidazolonepropionase-like amidohydrolase
VNGVVWTAVPNQPTAAALAIRGDRIILVGSDAEVRALAGSGTKIVDLGGRLVVPGFNDAHWHLVMRDSPPTPGVRQRTRPLRLDSGERLGLHRFPWRDSRQEVPRRHLP